MKRREIARKIAEDLLNSNTLDENNFNYDADMILEYVQDVVLEHLRDFSFVQGNIL